MAQGMQEAEGALRGARQGFEENVRDVFGNALLADFFEPAGEAAQSLSEAMEEAEREGRAVREMVRRARAIL